MTEIGELIDGRYRLERPLGSGGMGVVYLARDVGNDFHVAIKMLRSTVVESEEARTRLSREIRMLSLLHSPHVAELYSAGYLEDGSPYFVMEYLEGRDLKSELRRRGPLPLAEAAAYLVQACRGVAAAHQREIVHRDLKPHNMIVTNLQSVRKLKIVDFGVAKLLNSADPNLTATDAAIGTPLYMCPEQLLDTKMITPKADVWSLGVVLYELLTGFPPFHDDSAGAVIAAVTLDDPVPIRRIRPELPEAIERLIGATLQKIPSERLDSATEFEKLLFPYAQPLDSLVVPDSVYDETKWAYERPPRTRSQSILRKQIQEAVDGAASLERDTVRHLRPAALQSGSTPSAERLGLVPSLRHISVRPAQKRSRPVPASTSLPSATVTPIPAASTRRKPWLIAALGLLAVATVTGWFWSSRRANVVKAPTPEALVSVVRDDTTGPPAPASRNPTADAERPAIAPNVASSQPPLPATEAIPTSRTVGRSASSTVVRRTHASTPGVSNTAAPAKTAVPLHL